MLLTHCLQKVSHNPWWLLAGQSICTMSLQAGKTRGYGNERVQRLAQAAGETGDQLGPVPVHTTHLIWGKHNAWVLSEPVFVLRICFIFFCPCVLHNTNSTLFNPVEFLACIHSVTGTPCTAPSAGKYFSKLLELSSAGSVMIVIMN